MARPDALTSMGTLKIAVGIPTAGRKAILAYTIGLIARQTRPPDLLIVCPAAPEDVDAQLLSQLPFSTIVRSGERGSSAQRNQILVAADAADLIVFFDDDFFPELNYLEELERVFNENARVIAVTARPTLDGSNGPGLEPEAALESLYANSSVPADRTVGPCYGTYGCNMAFRMEPIRQQRVFFDENLPLYGWQEDVDFANRLSALGQVFYANALRGVHLGAKQGRTSGIRLGYSQISNPIYLIRKGTMSFGFGARLMWRNLLANIAKSLRPEPWIDRRGRLKGNLLAFCDLVRGRISPKRILELSDPDKRTEGRTSDGAFR